MNFSKQPPSKQWAALKFKGEKLAEVWFKPEGEPSGLLFRIPRRSFQIPVVAQRLTAENLLKAVGIAAGDVELWRHGDVSHAAGDDSDLQLGNPLPQPPPDATHLEILVRLKAPAPSAAGPEGGKPGVGSARWQELESRWRAVLGLEAAIEFQRASMESLRSEMDAALKRMLRPEEKLHALSSDVTQWNQAKSRLRYVVPKARDFIHRATWAEVTPERKRLIEFFRNPGGPDRSLSEIEKIDEELEVLRKERQVLSALGTNVSQECKGIIAEVQAALARLQSNAAARALKKKAAIVNKGKGSK